MIKFKLYSKTTNIVKRIGGNAKRQAIENPITAASLSLMSLNSAVNLYNTENSRKTRKRTAELIQNLSPKDKAKIIIQS